MIVYKIDYIKKGKVRSIEIKASNAIEAIKKFKKNYKGIIKNVTEINKKSLIDIIKEKVFNKAVNLEELIAILDQLYVMLDAGISIDSSLSQVIEGIHDKKLKKIFTDIYNKINAGYSLKEAFENYKDELGIIVLAMISLGEESGDLAGAVKSLVGILSEIDENRKRFKKATRYPLFIIVAMIIAFIIVIVFVIPPFKEIFVQLNTKLPLPTRILLWVENSIVHYGWMVLGISIMVFGVLNYFYNTNKKVKFFFDKMILKVYILGNVIELAMIGRFIYVFQSLINSGIPIVTALEISLEIVENSFLKEKLNSIKDEIVKGGTISKGFENSEIFESMIIQMVNAGEESGNLTKMLVKISDYYLNKYRYIVDNISTLIEPILIAAIAGFVFTLALGIFLPMWNLTQSFK